MFLVTLACEGGLPLKLVIKGSGYIRSYLRAVLELFDLYRDAGFAPERLVEMAADHLPRVLRQEVVYQIFGRLVEVIWRRRGQVAGAPDPIRALDEADPFWRSELPMSLDDEVAIALLRNLVDDVSRAAAEGGGRLKVERELVRGGGNWSLATSLDIPGSVEPGWVQARLRSQEGELGSRFEIYVRDGIGSAALVAFATERERDGSKVYMLERPRREAFRLRGGLAAGAIQLEVRSGRNSHGNLEFEGEHALSGLPWVFADRRGDEVRYRYIGEGSLRTRFARAVVTVTPGVTIAAMDGARVEPLGRLADPPRDLYEIEGSVRVIEDDEWCLVETGAEREEAPLYRFFGATLGHRTDVGTPVYRGWPHLLRRAGDGAPLPVKLDELEVQPAGGRGAWTPWTPGRHGSFQVRHRVNGALGFRASIAVVPDDIRISPRPGHDIQEGEMILDGGGSVELGWTRVDGCAIAMAVADGGGEIRLRCRAADPPVAIPLVLKWDGEAPVTLTVPFPSSGGRFVRVDEQVLKGHSSIALDDLGTINATAMSPNAGTRFSVVGRLYAFDIPHGLAGQVWVHEAMRRVASGRFELPLAVLGDRLRQMLASSKDLGAEVRLSIDSGAMGNHVLHVRRFAFQLSHEAQTEEFWLEDASRLLASQEMLERLVVDMRPVWDPTAGACPLEPICSEGSALGGWKAEPARLDPGPWLITGWEGELCRIHPQIWNVGDLPDDEQGDDPPADRALADIICISRRQIRQDMLAARMKVLADDPVHPDWEVLHEHLRAFRAMPASTLDVVEAVAECPQVAAMALMQANETGFDSLWDFLEELPFAWWAIAVNDWVAAARTLYGHYRTVLAGLGDGADTAARESFDVFLSRGAQRAEFFQVLQEALDAGVFRGFSPQLGLMGSERGAMAAYSGEADHRVRC